MKTLLAHVTRAALRGIVEGVKKSKLLLLLVVIVIAGLAYMLLRPDSARSPNSVKDNAKAAANKESSTKDSFDKNANSTSDPASIWVIVNKARPLDPQSYAPDDLVLPNVPQRLPGEEQMKMRAPAAKALESMLADAKTAGYQLEISTAYRSYSYQQTLYSNYVKADGQAKADTYSARPGYSEHQTGLAVDLQTIDGTCRLEQCFGDTPAAKWLAANAYKYGFLLRYPKGGETITGYEYEPWHFRYIGTELSTEMHKTGAKSLEAFFGTGAAPDYKDS